jgi:hypothetical protein
MRVRDHGHLAEWAALVGDDLPDWLEGDGATTRIDCGADEN